MFQQNDQQPNPLQQQNNSEESQLQKDNQNSQANENQPQNYFWRNIPYSEQQIQSKNQIENLILLIQSIPNDIFVNKQFLEKTCNKIQQKFLQQYDDVTDIEQLHQIIDKQYNKKIKEYELQISETPNLIYEWEDKVNISEIYQIMKIIKSPNRNVYLTKDITKEIYFDEVKENFNSGEQEYLNNIEDLQENLKGQGIFENFKVQPLQVLRKQLNIIKQMEFNQQDTFLYFEIYKILAFPYLCLNQCYKYDVEAQSVHFQLPKNINIEVRSNEIQQIPLLNENSIIRLIPTSLFQSNLLSFLGIIDIFKLRIVCRFFKTIVEKYWYIPSKKEIIQYEIAKDLAYNNEHLKNLQTAAQTLKQKLRTCVDIILNLINWNDLHEQIETGQIEIDIYRPLIMMLRLFNKQQKICYHYEIDGQFSIFELAKDIKQQILDYLNMEFIPLSFTQMRQLQQQALSSPEFNIIDSINSELNLSQLLTFLLQALYFHGWMAQVITIYKEILKKRNKELQIIDQKQNYNKDFIKQACKYIYKMNDFSPSKDTEEQIEIMTQIGQILQESLRHINFCSDANPQTHPQGVIYQKNAIIKIHLDIYFQIEILTYICSSQKYYFEDVVDEKLEMQFNQDQTINNAEKDNFPNLEEKQQNYSMEENSMQQRESIHLQQDINYLENEYN
ncbi:unnamed protein product [Paramecium sonneborni]|uniref:F-box domain-containing protein n=1 Tax=Paramecium sonneborni TaxID=65129 RepID=A0A8S1P3R9_9CILI|nr:unnamed protein product [Paramecium sonneborni]